MSNPSNPPPPPASIFPDPAVDRLAEMVMRLTAEVWVLKERSMLLEAAAAANGVIAADLVARFTPPAELEAEIRTTRAAFIRTVMGDLFKTR